MSDCKQSICNSNKNFEKLEVPISVDCPNCGTKVDLFKSSSSHSNQHDHTQVHQHDGHSG